MLFIIYLSYIFLIRPLLEARAEIQKYFHWFLVQIKTLKFAFKINWPLIVPSDFQTFLQSWLRGNSAKQQQCFCIFWLAFRTLFPKVQWERPIKSKWVEPWTFGSIDLKCCIWWFWIRTFDIYEIIWKVSTYHLHKYLLD